VLRGRFDNNGQPYVEGWIRFPRLGVQARLWFLVDTGCDVTTLMPKDGNGMGLPYDRLRNAQTTVGVGGPVECCPEAAVLAFYEDGRQIRGYALDVDVMRADGQIAGLPSLLGRDILDCWRMIYAPLAAQLDFEVLKADATIPI
jgi:hypothetical protein